MCVGGYFVSNHLLVNTSKISKISDIYDIYIGDIYQANFDYGTRYACEGDDDGSVCGGYVDDSNVAPAVI